MSEFYGSEKYEEIVRGCKDEDCVISGLCYYIDDLRAELEQARKELAEAKEIINGNAKEALVKSMRFEDGQMEFYLKHPLFSLFIDGIAHAFVESGAMNYLETRMFSKKLGFITVTVQKESGKTPHQIIEELRSELEQGRREINQLSDRVLVLRQELAALREAARWIPVAESLPEHGKDTWATNGKEVLRAQYYHFTGILCKHGWYMPDGYILGGGWATHWMDYHTPLPPAPEVEK